MEDILVFTQGGDMYAEILFALCCFTVGFVCGIVSFASLLLKGIKTLSKRMKPKP